MNKNIYQLAKQFLFYAFVGGIATFVDWGSFYLSNKILLLPYYVAVLISFTLGATTNYLLNKTITFKDKTKQVGAQLGIYITVSLLSLAITMGFMFVLVNIVKIDALPARILTTGIMLMGNFVMHKFLTFNKELYERLFNKQQ